MIDKVTGFKINNEVGNYLIYKVSILTINKVGNNMIKKVANLTINDAGNDSKKANVSDVQVQFAGNSARIYHQKLLRGWMIRIRQEEFPVLVPPT